MSIANTQNSKINYEFLSRFIEACGTTEAAKIQRLLDISYQAAKNYLNGRIPDSKVLITIAERTPYSIHWLLTGEGQKLAKSSEKNDTPPLSGQIRDLVREECLEILRDVIRAAENDQPRVITLKAENLSLEKVHQDHHQDELLAELNDSANNENY